MTITNFGRIVLVTWGPQASFCSMSLEVSTPFILQEACCIVAPLSDVTRELLVLVRSL